MRLCEKVAKHLPLRCEHTGRIRDDYAFMCIYASRHNAEHVQTSGPNMATATPLGPPRAQTAQKNAGLLELDAQPSVASIRLPEGAAPKVSAQCRCGELTSGHLHGIGPRTRNLEGS